ncbi:MAG: glycoside hydrolase family 3 C-terminal domain-containing protein [Bacilli bacterium]|nr:glycoside hydrolase family 3 C-terminal domain-containing protein [Bacilli bacterium]
MKKRQKTVLALWAGVSALLIGALVAGNVYASSWDQILGEYFGYVGESTSGTGEKKFVSEFSSQEEVVEAIRANNRETTGEGAVLIRNEKNALPLSSGNNVSVFGITSTFWFDLDRLSDKKSSPMNAQLKENGINLNKELSLFYKTSNHTAWGNADPKGDGDGAGEWKIDEIPYSEYTETVKNSYKDFNDAAIIVISRSCGEGADLPRATDRWGGSKDKHYLELSAEEEQLFQAVKDADFKKRIVVVHTDNAFELSFIDKYDIDAVLWVAGTGTEGGAPVGDILTGKINPSGRTVDTFTTDNLSAPVMQNFGDYRFVDSNGDETGFSYVNCAEGIYVGYKYYETRYEDILTHRGGAGSFDYDSLVVASMGHGLSYTDFTWSDYTCNYNDETDQFDISVNVKNSGTKYAGKDVVEIYSQSEYTNYDIEKGIEKAAVNLVGFAKTSLLNPGEVENIKISVDRKELASFDSSTGKYLLEKGNNYLAAGRNAHDALNNILTERNVITTGNTALVGKYVVETDDFNTYSEKVSNKFSDCKLEDAKYLSRSNWSVMEEIGTSTWVNGAKTGLLYADGMKSGISNTTNGNKDVNYKVVSEARLARLSATGWAASGNPHDPNDKTIYPDVLFDQPGDAVLADAMGKDYDDPIWDEILDKVKLDEARHIYEFGCYNIPEMPAIVKPALHAADGPEGVGQKNGCAQVLIASTWNKNLMEKYGKLQGEYGLWGGAQGWYAPGMNLHRSPFSGRNYEYTSEDPFMTGATAIMIIRGATSKGLATVAKHMAMNGQETNRQATGAVATYATEQCMRETYLKAFEMIIHDGNTYGIMQSMNRVGDIRARSNYQMNVALAEEEWGYTGYYVTDYNNIPNPQEVLACLAGGCNAQLYGSGNKLADSDMKLNGVRYLLRDTAHRILNYSIHSSTMDGFTKDSTYSTGVPVYVLMLVAVDVVVVAILASGILLTLRNYSLANRNCTDAGVLKANKILNIVYWAIVATFIIAAIVIFFSWGLPLLKQAFEIK